LKRFFTLLSMVCVMAAQTSKLPPRPEDALLAKIRAAREDSAKTVELVVEMVHEFPDSNGATQAGSYFASALRQQARADKSPEKLAALAKRYIEGIAKAPGQLCVRNNSFAVTAMMQFELWNPALALLQHTIPELDGKAYLEFARAANDRDNKWAMQLPGRKQYPFIADDWVERFQTAQATYFSQLGRTYEGLKDESHAEAAYRKTYSIEPTASAAMGIARILERKGSDLEAFDFMTRAALTGKLDKSGVAQFHALYAKMHNSSLEGLDAMLDERFREHYRNPIAAEKYQPSPKRSNRAALLEFFTGAGCIPCIPFDYTFEKALATYTRGELVILVYHIHAPTSDPMGNRSTEARQAYYDVHGAPTPYLDGHEISSPDNDVRNKAGATAASQRVYDEFRKAIDQRLETPAPITLRVEGGREAGLVHGVVTMTGSVNGTLHLALVENEVHYTGENGLRFHVMVVRNVISVLARERLQHSFDLAAITAANQRYYDEYSSELMAKVGARGATDFSVSFREQKHAMNPANLSLAAFVQDDKTKEVLQAAFIPVR
jgi:hypothetical protein